MVAAASLLVRVVLVGTMETCDWECILEVLKNDGTRHQVHVRIMLEAKDTASNSGVLYIIVMEAI